MSERLSVLIVGGYGTFGGRIVELLEDEPRLELIVAGRSLARAEQYCRSRQPAAATLAPAIFDRAGDIAAQLGQLRPDVLVDASGPFQGYGEDRYRVIEACLGQGVDYLDLADGSAFVAGVAAFDAAARAAGRYVLSGVSTFPVLTAAAVRRLGRGMSRVEAIRGGIAPSPFAGVGMNVVRAIAGYAGQPIALSRNGQPAIGHPFTEQVRFTISPPGRLPLRSTIFSLVDVPDLRVLRDLWPEATSVWMGAGPVPELLHRVLIAFAWLARARLIPSLAPLAPAMHFVIARLRWGEHRGGMFVEVEGLDADGAAVRRAWHLLAEGDAGPLIPSMAVAAIVRGVLAGRAPAPGARASILDLELEDYAPLFAGRMIFTGARFEPVAPGASLYQRILGDAWDALPPQIRAMHDVGRSLSAHGRASIERGRGPLAFVAGQIMGFPGAAHDTALGVRFGAADGVETWTGTFGTRSFCSRQSAGRGRWRHLLCERFGRLTFAMALVEGGGRLSLVLRGWRLFGLPLPMWLCPTSTAFEHIEGGRFAFYVEIAHPLMGLIVRYQGWLEPDAPDRGVGG